MLERSSGLLVCPISGTIRDDLGAVVTDLGEGDEQEDAEALAGQNEGDFGGEGWG